MADPSSSAGSGNVTLTISADTARFLARIEEAATKSKLLAEGPKEAGKETAKLEEHIKKTGEYAHDVFTKISGFAVPLSLAAAGAGLVDKSIESWKKKIEDAKEAAESFAHLFHSLAATGLSGETLNKTIAAVRTAAPALSDQQRIDVVAAVRGPTGMPNATPDQIAEVAAETNTAFHAGNDPAIFAARYTRLKRLGVPHASDVADYAQRYLGEESDQALDLVEQAPDKADLLLPLFGATAKMTGSGSRQVRSLLRSRFNDWVGSGRRTDLETTLLSNYGTSAEDRAVIEQIKRLRGEPVAIGAMSERAEANEHTASGRIEFASAAKENAKRDKDEQVASTYKPNRFISNFVNNYEDVGNTVAQNITYDEAFAAMEEYQKKVKKFPMANINGGKTEIGTHQILPGFPNFDYMAVRAQQAYALQVTSREPMTPEAFMSTFQRLSPNDLRSPRDPIQPANTDDILNRIHDILTQQTKLMEREVTRPQRLNDQAHEGH